MAQLDSYNYTRMEGTELELPPGFRFHPTDDELVKDYLCRKCAGQKLAVPIIAEIDLYKFDPWELPEMAAYGEKEWYFFSPRDRKYPNGSRPNRAAGNGFWKATGADKPIGKPDPAGIKKALVFYAGKAPRGIKTNWIMHEYRLANVDRSARKNSNSRLDEWVLCRLYNKKGTMERYDDYTMDVRPKALGDSVDLKPNIKMSQPSLVDGPFIQFHSHGPDSGLWSSGSEHVLSPEVTCYKEVQSQPRSKTHDLDNLQFSYIDEYDDTFAMDHLNMFISP